MNCLCNRGMESMGTNSLGFTYWCPECGTLCTRAHPRGLPNDGELNWVRPERPRVESAFKLLTVLVKQLRAPNGCPHDRATTLDTWSSHTTKETGELNEAINKRDFNNTQEELGDVMLCLVMIGSILEELEVGSMENALTDVYKKMVRRHPHVFGDAVANTPAEADALFNEVKSQERKGGDRGKET